MLKSKPPSPKPKPSAPSASNSPPTTSSKASTPKPRTTAKAAATAPASKPGRTSANTSACSPTSSRRAVRSASRSCTSMIPTAQIRLRRPHPAQELVIHDARRFNVLVCGRRWGKTELLINRLVHPMLAGRPVAWFAPNEKYFDEVWREANRVLAPIITRSDSQKKRLEVTTGGVMDFWTLHNTDDPGRGRKYARVAIDEAAIVPSHRLEVQWNEAIRPTLTDYEGDAFFASTPKGVNYFHELYQRSQRGEEGWASWQMPTTANPHIKPSEVEAARRELPNAVFRQEYLAEFVTDFGAVFKPATLYEPDELPRNGFREATGCDFAYTSKAGDW